MNTKYTDLRPGDLLLIDTGFSSLVAFLGSTDESDELTRTVHPLELDGRTAKFKVYLDQIKARFGPLGSRENLAPLADTDLKRRIAKAKRDDPNQIS